MDHTPPPRSGPASRAGRRVADPHLRVSDAERREVVDALSAHYAEGRLDEAEFTQRHDQAMGAKTRADLAGLLADLPGPEAPEPAPAPPRRRRPRSVALLVAVAVLAALAVAHPFHVLWVPALIVLACVLGCRHRHRQPGLEGPARRGW
ncbi:MAG TPA: DUF1707 domain-containing protein [Acidimicrobiales bacterium]|nr:DUF1707 domain-containing protein [Acidimicrobiales bacterium]